MSYDTKRYQGQGFGIILEKTFNGYSLREIERLTGHGLPSVRRYVQELVKEKLVKGVKMKRFFLYYANRETRQFKLVKNCYMVPV